MRVIAKTQHSVASAFFVSIYNREAGLRFGDKFLCISDHQEWDETNRLDLGNNTGVK